MYVDVFGIILIFFTGCISFSFLDLQGGTPRFYIKALAELEQAVKDIKREDTKKMSRRNATG